MARVMVLQLSTKKLNGGIAVTSHTCWAPSAGLFLSSTRGTQQQPLRGAGL